MRLTDDARHSSPGEVTMSFREVLEKYGWCYPGKMAAHAIHYAKEGKQWALTNAGGRKPRSVSTGRTGRGEGYE